MKTIKIVGIITGILIAGLITLSLSIDGIVKGQLEQNMSSLMQTDVEVEDVDISIFSTNSRIEGLAIENPDGFSGGNAIYLNEINLKLDLMSLFKDQVIVNEVVIRAPDLLVEQEGVGVNLRTLMNNMHSDTDTGDEQASGKGLIVERLIVENGSMEVVTNVDKKRTTTATIDRFELTRIGRNSSNTLQQSIKQIMTPILEEALTEALREGAVDQLKDAAQELLGG